MIGSFDYTPISPKKGGRGRQTHPGSSATPSYIESFHFQPERLNRNRVIHFSVPKSVKIAKSRVGQNLAVCVCAHRESNRRTGYLQLPSPTPFPLGFSRHRKLHLLRISYASKIYCVCPHARRGFFRAQNSDFEFFRIKNTPKTTYSRL